MAYRWHGVKHCSILIFLPHIGQPAEDQHAHYHHQHQQPQLFITVPQCHPQRLQSCYVSRQLEYPEYPHDPEYLGDPSHL